MKVSFSFTGVSSLLICAFLVSVPLDGVLEVCEVTRIGPFVAGLMVLVIVGCLFSISRRIYLCFPALLLLMWSAASLIWSRELNTALLSLILQTYLMVPLFFVSAVPTSHRGYRVALAAFSLALCACLLFGMFQFLYMSNAYFYGRMTVSEQYNPSFLAAQAGIGLITSTTLLMDARSSKARIFWLLNMMLATIGLILTQGRNATLSVIMAAFLINGARIFKWISSAVLLGKTKRREVGTVFFVGLFTLSVVGVLIAFSNVSQAVNYDRWLYLIFGDSNQATAGRTELWADYIRIMGIDIQSLIGSGIWSSPTVYSTHYFSPHPPHNAFICVFVELGILGAIFYLMIFIVLGVYIFRLHGTLAKGSQTVLLYAFFLSFGNDMLTDKYFWLALSICLVLAFCAISEDAEGSRCSAKGSRLLCAVRKVHFQARHG